MSMLDTFLAIPIGFETSRATSNATHGKQDKPLRKPNYTQV